MRIFRSTTFSVSPKRPPAFHSNLFLFPKKKKKDFPFNRGWKTWDFVFPQEKKLIKTSSGCA